MESLKRVRFFEANPEFAITSPPPFAYGRRALVVPDRDLITWWDARSHGVTVKRVGENTRKRLVVFDLKGRKFVFEPLTARHLATMFPETPPPKTDEEARLRVRNDGYDW